MLDNANNKAASAGGFTEIQKAKKKKMARMKKTKMEPWASRGSFMPKTSANLWPVNTSCSRIRMWIAWTADYRPPTTDQQLAMPISDIKEPHWSA